MPKLPADFGAHYRKALIDEMMDEEPSTKIEISKENMKIIEKAR